MALSPHWLHESAARLGATVATVAGPVMSTVLGEGFALVGMGVLGAGIIYGISSLTVSVMEDNKIDPPKPKTQFITQETEDSLPIDTLDKLLYHPSYSIREVSLKILCDRAVNDEDTKFFLLHGIMQKDYDHRSECLRAIGLLMGQSAESMSKLHDDKSYIALVASLEIGLDDMERPKLDDPNWDEYHLRDVTERLCLVLIYNLVQKHGPRKLVKAGFVEKWLARQNWGDSESEVLANFSAYRKNRRDNLIRDIIEYINNTRAGLLALRKAKLVSYGSRMSSLGRRRSGASSSSSDSDSSLERRRQRREAFVLHDGDGPINHSNIIQRDPHRNSDDLEAG